MTYLSFLFRRSGHLLFNPVNLCLGLSIALSFALLGFRMFYTGERIFLFLVWNLFLAGLPLVASTGLKFLHQTGKFKWYVAAPILLFWIAFLPNSPYIITDMVHLRPRATTYLWLDVITIMSFAWSGLILGFISLRDVQEVISKTTSRFWGWITVILALGASSFGVYLGRYLRWNSWDVLSNPQGLLADISNLVFNPMDNKNMVAMTVCFSAFLFVAYLTITNLHRRESVKIEA